MTTNSPKIVKAKCSTCGGGLRNHVVVAEEESHRGDEHGWESTTRSQIVRCQGCDDVRFRREYLDCDDLNEYGEPELSITVYPEDKPVRRQYHADLQSLPPMIRGMYVETIATYNAGANVLTGGGLRAIVEAICKERQLKGSNLQEKIERLVECGLLAKPQADLLHEERFLGNAALHELEAPADSDLKLGLDIIEALLMTIYVLPAKAERLKKAREAGKNTDSLPHR